jgi:hypothetical protein
MRAMTRTVVPTSTLVHHQSTPFRVTIDVTWSDMLSPILDHRRDRKNAAVGRGLVSATLDTDARAERRATSHRTAVKTVRSDAFL